MKRINPKRIIAFLLVLSIIISITSITVFATDTTEQCTISQSYETSTFYYNEETGTIEYTEEENLNSVPFESSIIQLSNGQEDIQARANVEVFKLNAGLQKYSSGIYTWYFNVDCPSALIFKPKVTVLVQLQVDYTNGYGIYQNVGTPQIVELNSNFDYAEDYTFTTASKTGYYRFYWEIYAKNSTTAGLDASASMLLNRTGHPWFFEFSDGIGKTLPLPRADYVKGATCIRDSTLPNRYYVTYTNITGIELDRDLYDVHHMQPLSYGGNNDYDNLIHLPKNVHTAVTGWFNGY